MSLNTSLFPAAVWDRSSPTRAGDFSLNRSPDYEDWDQIVAEVIAVQTHLLSAPAAAEGTAGVGVTSVGVPSAFQTLTLTLVDASIPTADHTTNGASGGLKILDFPAGNIHILGAVCDLTTLAGAGGLADTAALVFSLGSVVAATDNATLTSTEANVIPSTSGTLSGGAGTVKGKSTGAVTLDGTGTPASLYLNAAVVDAGTSADDTIAVNGTVTITYVNLGDVA